MEQYNELKDTLYDASHTAYNTKDFGELSRYTITLASKTKTEKGEEKKKKQVREYFFSFLLFRT